MFSIISFHVGDIYSADPNWNRRRWQQILDAIQQKNADIIILHELNAESTAFFDSILQYENYDKTAPYQRERHGYQTRDNWEVIYSKLSINAPYYIPLTDQDGLSCFRCQNGVTICATTLNPTSDRDLERIRQMITLHFDSQTPVIVALSSNQMGSYLLPPRHFNDTWVALGSSPALRSTLNPKFARSPRNNNRADQIWFQGGSNRFTKVVPLEMSLLPTEDGSDHHGLYAVYDLSLAPEAPRFGLSSSVGAIPRTRRKPKRSRSEMDLSRSETILNPIKSNKSTPVSRSCIFI